MDAVLSFVFDHAYLVFGGVIAAFLVVMYLVGRPRRWWKWILQAGAVGAIAVAVLILYAFAAISSALNQRVSTLRFTEYGAASQQRIADYRGKVVFLNYWATWCPPCREEIPDINRLADSWRGRDVVFLAVTDEDAAIVQKFMATFPMRTTVARFQSEPPKSALAKFAYQGRPTTMIVDREGRVRRVLIGKRSFEEFDAAIKAAM
ncbi:MAG TPA: TlpA disulfide reductase family protein [Thermoanaerobaculia bacterium]|nr:TlpA disulfide reductase family protein [Thermoanaerobaculia bacterium]